MSIINDLKRATREGGVVVTPAGGESAPSGGSVLLITDTDGTLDKTFAEIKTAVEAGTLCVVQYDSTDTGAIIHQVGPIIMVSVVVDDSDSTNVLYRSVQTIDMTWEASADDAYPVSSAVTQNSDS